MNRDMTYCINAKCPYTDCERHVSQLAGERGTFSFANFDGVCRKYICYIVDSIQKENKQWEQTITQ